MIAPAPPSLRRYRRRPKAGRFTSSHYLIHVPLTTPWKGVGIEWPVWFCLPDSPAPLQSWKCPGPIHGLADILVGHQEASRPAKITPPGFVSRWASQPFGLPPPPMCSGSVVVATAAATRFPGACGQIKAGWAKIYSMAGHRSKIPSPKLHAIRSVGRGSRIRLCYGWCYLWLQSNKFLHFHLSKFPVISTKTF